MDEASELAAVRAELQEVRAKLDAIEIVLRDAAQWIIGHNRDAMAGARAISDSVDRLTAPNPRAAHIRKLLGREPEAR